MTTDGIRILTSDEICSRRLHVKAKHIRSSESLLWNISTRTSVGKRNRLPVICGTASRSWHLLDNERIAKEIAEGALLTLAGRLNRPRQEPRESECFAIEYLRLATDQACYVSMTQIRQCWIRRRLPHLFQVVSSR